MSVRLILGASLAVLGVTALSAWLFEISFTRAALLAPVLVAGAGGAAGLLVLWSRAALESLRRVRNPRRAIALTAAALALVALLTLLGVQLPRE